MKRYYNLPEMHEIISANHKDPHHILGIHKVTDKKYVINVFQPYAKQVEVISDDQSVLLMEKHHEDGFYSIFEPSKINYKIRMTSFDENTWEMADPYAFDPVISDMDVYLFNKGTHYEIYDKLGAHPMTLDGVDGVQFAVWAPNAKRVSVIGNFSNWDGRVYPMRSLDNSGIYELFIPGLQVNEVYKYEIKNKDGHIIEKADPFANYAEMRPSTASKITSLKGYTWNDKQWIDARDERFNIDIPMSIYEVHLGSWKRTLDNNYLSYKELAHDLVDYVADMGYTHIELMPVTEYPYDGSWGYQVTGYFAPTSRFGEPIDFMYFIDHCHQNNIGVIMDWVPAHFPKDAHGLIEFDGSALYEHEDVRQGEHPQWGTKIFNFERNEVANFLIANAIFWIKKFHIDGLRVDAVASMLYLDYGKEEGEWVPNSFGGRENLGAEEFLKHMNSIIYGMYPGIHMIAEESTAWQGVSRPTDKGGLGFGLKWNMGWMNDFLAYIEEDPIHRQYHHGELTFGMVYAYTENFILVLSHDEVVHGKGSIIGKMPGDYWQKFANVRVAYGFMYGHPGKKLLFMGSEFGQFEEWNEDKSLDWHLLEFDKHRELQAYIKDLNHIYTSEKAMWYDDFTPAGFEWINCSDAENSI
ncbi:MAG: 1,4-alpha-glucan branching protein GlgB, partial [Vallitaleaceae bacterium]|nr:1,4-alpha-glucan branching protein GlgB [Vallitaleaceae bacterium]